MWKYASTHELSRKQPWNSCQQHLQPPSIAKTTLLSEFEEQEQDQLDLIRNLLNPEPDSTSALSGLFSQVLGGSVTLLVHNFKQSKLLAFFLPTPALHQFARSHISCFLLDTLCLPTGSANWHQAWKELPRIDLEHKFPVEQAKVVVDNCSVALFFE